MENSQNNSDKDLAQVLKTKKDVILDKWERKVRENLPSASRKDHLAILNSIPDFLDEMIEILTSHPTAQEMKRREICLALEHGKERSSMTDYTLDQVISEYNILRTVIFDEIDPQAMMTLGQAKVFWDLLFNSINNAATEFAKSRESKLKSLTKETETKFSSIIDAVQDYAIFTLDSHGFIQTWNSGAVRMKGYSYEEAIGSNFSMLYPENERRRNEPMDHLKVARIEGRFRGEGMRQKKNGQLFLADVFIIPIRQRNEVVGFAKIVQDLSEHNQLIQERDISRTEANNLKVENELRETFVAALSHDLRNPLSAAKTSAQLIMRNSSDQEKNITLASKIVDHINRTDKMISNLLDANRLRAGEELRLHKSECDLMEIILEVTEELSTIYGNKIIVKGHETVKGFWDCEGMRRIFENLITNAIKYGDASRPVTASLEVLDCRVIGNVHNFGKVIEIPDQLLLFEKFHQINTSQDKNKGWGLGLTIVKGLVEAHQGTIRVNSYPKEGTTFTVDLPIDTRS